MSIMPDRIVQLPHYSFDGDSLPQLLRRMADFLEENPEIDQSDIQTFDVAFDDNWEPQFVLCMTGTPDDN